jgi:hypothetical protein
MAPASGRRACLATIYAILLSTLLAPCLAAEYTQKNTTSTPGYRLLPGVASIPAPVVVAPDQDWWGIDGLDNDCENSRGLSYNNTASSTWRQRGFYQLWLEKWLGLDGNGFFGFDTVSLGLPGEKGPTVQNTIIGTLISANFWTGHLGLHVKPTNFSAFEDPVPSFITTLFQQRNIPSLSFGYTAGSQYRT